MINEFVEPGHFYSVIPKITGDYNVNDPIFSELDYNDANHIAILNEISGFLTMFDETFGASNASDRQKQHKYTLPNGAFEWMDARMLHYFIQKKRPNKIIEIGSGNSTLLMENTKQMFGLNTMITCIEPYPMEFLNEMHASGKINLITDRLENIDLAMFQTLEENDILFIDSSHVAKLGSDVMYYFTKIFPLLKKGVNVHIHDIFFPFDYPLDWLKEGRFWNEQYLLYVFLQYNTKYKIQFCNSYSGYKFGDQLKKIQENSYEINTGVTTDVFSGGSIWLSVQE